MSELARFASSDAGKSYARIEQFWGRDPAVFLEDDVLAHNFRAALLVTLSESEEEDVPMDTTEEPPLKMATRG